jgi:multidrug efflux pump subunit AcrA (membrane-fusion protein)
MKNEGMSMLNQKNIEIHSEPIREIMGQIPHWIIRWGITVIFSIVMLLMFGAYMIKYPETITAPIIITTTNTPAELICKAHGKIVKFCVKEGQQVMPGYLIAVIENTANYDHYCILKKEIDEISNDKDWKEVVLERENSGYLSLGDMQMHYEQFRKTWNDFRNYLRQGYIQQKITLIEKQIKKQEEYHQILLQQLAIANDDRLLAIRRFKRDSTVFINGGYSITEFETEKRQLNQKEASLKSIEASIKDSELTTIKLNQNIIELRLQLENEISTYKLKLDEIKQNLKTSIRKYEEQYLIKSPIEGTVTLSSFWSENQVVTIGDRITTIIPEGITKIIGKAVVPKERFGMVKPGQQVSIKLFGFPYMEFGIVVGKVKNIARIPDDNGYIAEIDLPDGLVTSYHKQLNFTQEMSGTVDIITQDKRLISRFINPIRSLLLNH